jgi:thiol-disulfide isomerase/thioredoxin
MDDISTIGSTPPAPTPRRPAGGAPRWRALPLVVASAAAIALLPACSSDDGASGEPWPEAPLVTLADEAPAALADLAGGTPTVVNFWASWCAPCRAEMPAFQQVADDLDGQVAIIGITDEDQLDAARDAADDAGVSYPLLVDTEQTLLSDLSISGLPGTVFLDEDGNVIGRHLGAMDEDDLLNEIEDRYGITA